MFLVITLHRYFVSDVIDVSLLHSSPYFFELFLPFMFNTFHSRCQRLLRLAFSLFHFFFLSFSQFLCYSFFVVVVAHVHILTRLFSLFTFSHLLLSPSPQLAFVHADAVSLCLRYTRLCSSFVLLLHFAVFILLSLMNQPIPLQV
jgi:hypothetical protein